jgi:hypothetical protein
MALGSEVPEDTMARQDTDEDVASGNDGPGEGLSSSMQKQPSRRDSAGPEVFSLLEDDDLEVECEVKAEPSRCFRLSRQFAGLLLVGALMAAASCWGVHIGTQLQLQRQLEERALEAATVVPAAQDAAGDDAGKCIVDVALGEDGQRLELQRRSGEKTSIVLPRNEVSQARPEPSQGDTSESRGLAGGGSGQPGTHTHVDPGKPATHKHVKQENSNGKQDTEYPDLACENTRHAEWLEIKRSIGSRFGPWQAGVAAINRTELHGELEAAIMRLQAVHHEIDECGMGRLCMTLFALAAGEAGGSLSATPSLHSPLLTILLDVPWTNIMLSGWPLFGILSQLNLQQKQKSDLPTTGGSAEYFTALRSAISDQRPEVLASLGADFVKQQDESGTAVEPQTGVMPALCALASQLLGTGVFADLARAEESLRHMQSFYKQAVNGIDDLQSTIDSAWPLYGVLNAAAVELAAASAGVAR